jgi:hypothetical protein
MDMDTLGYFLHMDSCEENPTPGNPFVKKDDNDDDDDDE